MWQILRQITLPLAVPGLISAGIFSFTLSWNEFIYSLAFIQSGEKKTLFFNLSGHGHFDMASYDKYFAGELVDYDYPEEAVKEALKRLPKIAA